MTEQRRPLPPPSRTPKRLLRTASYAAASSNSVADSDLTWRTEVCPHWEDHASRRSCNLPLTVDLRDGYDKVAATI